MWFVCKMRLVKADLFQELGIADDALSCTDVDTSNTASVLLFSCKPSIDGELKIV